MKKILVLDDSATVRNSLASLLERWGYQALLAASPEEAVQYLAEDIDFAIVDVFLDGANGEHLSAEFISTHLDSKGINYGRFSSAPEAVRHYQRGEWVLHKYDVRNDPELLREALIESCGSS